MTDDLGQSTPAHDNVGAEVTDEESDPVERLRRWRLVLGGDDADGIGDGTMDGLDLSADDLARDGALGELYDGERRAGLGASAPRVARWLGDIRTYFPSSVVQVMQADAMDRLGLRQLLVEPEMLEAVEPDLSLVTTLVGLGSAIPETSRQTARQVVRTVTDDLEQRLADATRQAVSGAVDRSARSRRPRPADIDWLATIAANLDHYQPRYRTVVPERLVGRARRRSHIERELILCVDQSGSMAESIVYASVFGSVLASLRSVRTHLVAFDTEVVDLSAELTDPVDVLFGLQLGGGTDINQAVSYCQGLVGRPSETVFVLISDLYEGGLRDELGRRIRQLVDAGVVCVALLALSDNGAPAFDADHAALLSSLGMPAFACTPDLFPDLMATAIEGGDVGRWADVNGLVVHQGVDEPRRGVAADEPTAN